MTAPDQVAGLLLTGGRSRRMGSDKAGLVVGGEPLGRRLGRLLASVADPVLEVGPGASGLEAVREDPPFGGPLAAVVAGWRGLGDRGHTGAVLVVACDLPLLDAPLITMLARWPAGGSVVPVLDGRRQLLSARWSPGDLDAATSAFAGGERALRAVPLGPGLVELGEGDFPAGAPARGLADVDTPEDLARLGLAAAGGSGR